MSEKAIPFLQSGERDLFEGIGEETEFDRDVAELERDWAAASLSGLDWRGLKDPVLFDGLDEDWSLNRLLAQITPELVDPSRTAYSDDRGQVIPAKQLIRRGRWYALARWARASCVETGRDETNLSRLLQYWTLFLAALVALGKQHAAWRHAQRLQEVFRRVLSRREDDVNEGGDRDWEQAKQLLPWTLRCLLAHLERYKESLPDKPPDKVVTPRDEWLLELESLWSLYREAKPRMAAAVAAADADGRHRLWQRRTVAMAGKISGLLLHLEQYQAAVDLLVSVRALCEAEPEPWSESGPRPCHALDRAIVLVTIAMGRPNDAEQWIKRWQMTGDDLASLLHAARGQWDSLGQGAVGESSRRMMANRAVGHLYAGDVNAAIHLLEEVLYPSLEAAGRIDERLVFNLSTLYELKSEASNERKMALVRQVVSPFADDTFHRSALKV